MTREKTTRKELEIVFEAACRARAWLVMAKFHYADFPVTSATNQ